jgi:hypothetical protein
VLLDHAADYAQRQSGSKEKPQPESQELLQRMPEHVRAEARAMLESPELMKRVIDDVAACGVAGERELVASIYLVGVSRLLPRPLAAIVQAPSSTGKSYVIDRTTELFPSETVIRATAMTPNALFYLEPGALRHRFIVAGERSRIESDESAEATRALREMLGSGRLSKMLPMKEGNQMVTRLVEQDGPIAFVESTTMTQIFDEDRNRCLLLAADETTTQTRSVINRLAVGYGTTSGISVAAIVEKHYAAQRMLQQRPVYVPFAERVGEMFPDERVEARRAFPHLMSMIQASALLHQYQRPLDGDGRIVAHPDDYQLARHLCGGPLARLLGGRISDAAIRFHDRLTGWANEFTTTEAAKQDRKAQQTVRDWLKELAEAGAVAQVESSKGSRPATWKVTGIDRHELASDCGLPLTIE